MSGFAFSPREVYFGTDTGSLLLWNGERTRGTTFPTQAGVGLRAILGVSPTELYVGGEGGRIFRFDGTTWTRELISTAVANAILHIHRGPSGVVVAAGSGGVLLERNPATRVWTPISISPPASPAFRRIHVAEPFLFAISDVGQVYRGVIGSSQVSPLGPAPVGLLPEQNAAAFSADAGFVVVAGGSLGPPTARALMLDLRQSAPAWVQLADFSGFPFSAVEVQAPRVFFSGERGAVAVVTLSPDGGAGVEGPLLPVTAPLYRTVVPTATDEVVLGGQSGVMGFLARDAGSWTVTDNEFAQNRFENLNDGCAAPGVVAGSPAVFVTGAGNRIGSRSNRWSWQSGGAGGVLALFEWNRCHAFAPDQAWAVGNDRAIAGPISRVSRRSGTTWTEVDTPQFSQQWTAVSGFPDGTTYFLASGNVVLVNADGGTALGSFRRVVLDGGPLNDLLALSPTIAGAVQGAMNNGNHFIAPPQLSTWNVNGSSATVPNDYLALHGIAQGSGFVVLTVGNSGLVTERRQGVGGTPTRIPGVGDLTDVWVSRSLNAYIATTTDAGTLVGRTSATVIFRAPDGGLRFEPVPVSQRIRGLFGVDDLDGTTRLWATGVSGAILRRDVPDGG